MRFPRGLLVATILLLAIVVQTTLFGRMRPFVPDLTLLVVILLALTRIRAELTLATAFLAGIAVDLLGSSLLGLRAVVFTIVVYIAIKTRSYAEIGRFATALWAGLLTLLGMVLILLLSTLFGQMNLVGAGIGQRLILVPIANMVLAALIAPVLVRVIERDTGLFRFS